MVPYGGDDWFGTYRRHDRPVRVWVDLRLVLPAQRTRWADGVPLLRRRPWLAAELAHDAHRRLVGARTTRCRQCQRPSSLAAVPLMQLVPAKAIRPRPEHHGASGTWMCDPTKVTGHVFDLGALPLSRTVGLPIPQRPSVGSVRARSFLRCGYPSDVRCRRGRLAVRR